MQAKDSIYSYIYGIQMLRNENGASSWRRSGPKAAQEIPMRWLTEVLPDWQVENMPVNSADGVDPRSDVQTARTAGGE